MRTELHSQLYEKKKRSCLRTDLAILFSVSRSQVYSNYKAAMKESVAPECGPFVLLTSPSAENTNATSQRSYNNTVGIGFLLCLHFSLVYPCKKKGKKCPCTTQHRLWSLTARLKRHPSPSALLFNKTSTVTVKTRTTTNTRV